jgi:hypothetical protein
MELKPTISASIQNTSGKYLSFPEAGFLIDTFPGDKTPKPISSNTVTF